MHEWMKWGVIFTLLFGVGFLRMSVWIRAQVPVQSPVTAMVVEPGLVRSTTQVLRVQEEVSGQTLRILTQQYPRYRYGDILVLKGKIDDNDSMFFPQIEVVEGSSDTSRYRAGQGSVLLAGIYQFRERLQAVAGQVFTEPAASLVSGIVFGIESDLGKRLNEQMRTAGLVHVVVASGYNVSVVIGYLAVLTKWVDRRLGLLLSGVGILIYAVIAGLGAPIIRASIMGGATLLAVTLGRQKNALLWLFFSALIMLIWNPTLYGSLSFQLSFAATLAILVIQLAVEKLLLLLPGVVREDVATTLSVQVLTMPLIWFRIGVAQPIGLLVNALTLWLIPLIMLVGSLAVAVGSVNLMLGRVVAIPVQMMVGYVLWMVEIFT